MKSESQISPRFADKFQTSELRYGFKPKSSATQCTFSLLETVNHFQQNNTDIYVLLLDASSAFDKVNYVKLFDLLLERGVDPITMRCPLYMYTNQHVDNCGTTIDRVIFPQTMV